MLTRRLASILGALLGALLSATLGVLPAQATVQDWDVGTDVGGGSGGGGSGGGGGGSGGSGCFAADGTGVPCVNPRGGQWTGTCYEEVFSHGPDEKTLVWPLIAKGRTDGVIMVCCDLSGSPQAIYWRQSAAPPPSAAELEQAARLMLEGVVAAPGIGVYPGFIDGTDPEATGIVGWPTWFWAESPGEGVGQPSTKSTAVAGYTLRATARLVDIVYDTGDGHQVTCGLGAIPAGANLTGPADPPPACGWTYERRGHYTVTATTRVTVDWSGAGRAGSIPITVTQSGRYDVSEIQVIIIP